jgi:hypothetical protein
VMRVAANVQAVGLEENAGEVNFDEEVTAQ